MSVWKRTWTLKEGKERHAWIADYYDGDGDRHVKAFRTKEAARDYLTKVRGDLNEGVHVAPRKSATVKNAADYWIAAAESDGLERATIKQYREHVDQHIVPMIGTVKLCDLTVAAVRRFEDRLCEEGRSPAMRRKILGSLGALVGDAQERGLCAHNAVREMSKRRRGKNAQAEKRHKRKIQAGVDLPTMAEARAIMAHAEGRWRALLITVIFTGLRASELRGLRWCDLDGGVLHVHQRADRFNVIGSPKSASSERTVPIPIPVRNALREWRLKRQDHKRANDLIFSNGQGNPESLANIINRGLIPAQLRAGITREVLDSKGKRPAAKYTGLHCLRHFFASWCLAPKEDGGCGYTLKRTSTLMGHSSSIVTASVYEHLLPSRDDSSELDATASALMG